MLVSCTIILCSVVLMNGHAASGSNEQKDIKFSASASGISLRYSQTAGQVRGKLQWLSINLSAMLYPYV